MDLNDHKNSLENLMKELDISEDLITFCISVGLRFIDELDEEELREEKMKQYDLTEDKIESLIKKLNNMSWTYK